MPIEIPNNQRALPSIKKTVVCVHVCACVCVCICVSCLEGQGGK